MANDVSIALSLENLKASPADAWLATWQCRSQFPGIVGTEGNDDVATVGREDYLMAGWIAHVKDCGSRLETGVRRHV
jgi:hypothetical protein